MAKLKFKNPVTGLWEEVGSSLQNLKDGTGAGSLYMNNTSELSEPNDGGELHPTPDTTSTAPIAAGAGAFAVGIGTQANGDVSVAEGILTKAGYLRDNGTRSVGSHAEGVGTFAKSSASHAEGYHTQALASNSHTEGFFNTVESTAWSGHAEGRENTVTGKAAHAEGYKNTVSGDNSHAEGENNTASGDAAHVEGKNTVASGLASHAEGISTTASGKASHAGGIHNEALNYASTVIGQYAKKSIKSATVYDSTGEAFVVGNGTSDTSRSNAFEVHFDGTAKLGDKNVATEDYVDNGLKVKAGLTSANTFTGANTFSGTVTVPTPTADNQAATKKYVDDHAGGGSATIGNVTATATSIDSSKPATVTATTSGNDISFAFGIPKGATGNSGVYLGTTTPTDPSVMVWVNPSGMTIEDGTEVAYG